MDAAVAALFCLGVMNPHNSGIRGGAFMTIFDPSCNQAVCIDGRPVAPLAATENMFGNNPSLSSTGPLSVAVPGELAAMQPGRLTESYRGRPT